MELSHGLGKHASLITTLYCRWRKSSVAGIEQTVQECASNSCGAMWIWVWNSRPNGIMTGSLNSEPRQLEKTRYHDRDQ